MTHDFELVVVRHGQTAWNAAGRFQGHTDVPLDEIGREQARAAGLYLAHDDFEYATSSDLARASETGAIVLGARAVALVPDSRWREMRFGEWEGLTWTEIVQRTPGLAGRSATAARDYAPQGGETFHELTSRVAAALAAIDARVQAGARVLVATHAGPLHALLRIALGGSQADSLGVRFSPGSVTRFSFGPGVARVIEMNATPP